MTMNFGPRQWPLNLPEILCALDLCGLARLAGYKLDRDGCEDWMNSSNCKFDWITIFGRESFETTKLSHFNIIHPIFISTRT